MTEPAWQYPWPEPTTPLEVAEADAGLLRGDLEQLRRLAGLTPEQLLVAIEKPGWLERLKTVIVDREIALRIKPIGPEGARALTAKDCFEKIGSAKLRTAAASYVSGAALLLGATGVGKTLTALLMARKAATGVERRRLEGKKLQEACSRDNRPALPAVAWVSCAELPRLVSSQPFGAEPALLRQAKAAPLVVLDDLLWGDNDKALLEIIAHRYDHGMPSIATAGATRDELVKRFGDAVVRRLLECRGVKGLVVEAF